MVSPALHGSTAW
jgi:hypothetical protein